MKPHPIGLVSELPPGSRKIVDIGGRSVGVFNVDGRFFALRNTCPHQGAPLCLGSIGAAAAPSAPGEYVWGSEGRILRCPWHGWEFDITTGESVFNPHGTKVRSFEVTVDPATPPDDRVETYDTSVEDGVVLVHA